MDPITAAILAALVAGAAAGATQVATQAVVDAYNALKAKLKAKFGGESKIVQAVNTLEQEPEFKPNQDALAARVDQTKAAQDAELKQLAQALKAALNETPEGKRAWVQVQNSQVGVIGDHAKVEGGIHFGETKK